MATTGQAVALGHGDLRSALRGTVAKPQGIDYPEAIMAAARKPGSVRLVLTADYHQIHLLDDDREADLGEAWTVQATEDLQAVTAGALGLGTVEAAEIPVTVEVLAAAPPLPAKADHMTEASLELRSGRLVVLGCTDYLPDARRIPLVPGWYRVRTTHTGMAKQEKLAVVLWPAPAADPLVLRRWMPPQPKPAATVRAPKNLKQAAQAARRGALELAEPVLTRLADAGDGAAAASLAEILAFRGDWAGFVTRAEAYLADPTVIAVGNVFTDLTRCFRRAARELGAPELIERAAARVPERYQQMAAATLLEDRMPPSWSIVEPSPERRAAYDRAVAEATAGPRFAGKPDHLGRHCFSLAGTYHVEEELLRLYQELGASLQFDDALTVARWHVFRGRSTEGWAVIEQALPRWWPVAVSQIAPTALLVDPLLAPLLSPARCAQVLATPRGPE